MTAYYPIFDDLESKINNIKNDLETKYLHVGDGNVIDANDRRIGNVKHPVEP